MKPCVLLFALCFVGAALPAQVTGQEPTDVAAELARVQRTLNQNRGEVDRLLDLRIRHDLGLSVERDTTAFQSAGPVTTESMERTRRELADQDAITSTIAERYRKLKASVEQLRADAVAHGEPAVKEGEFVVVPAPGNAVARSDANDGARKHPAGAGATAPAPNESGSPKPIDATAFHGLDPIRGQIHGCEDHQRVAQALFKAGQELMDRAAMLRGQQQEEAANELDNRAKERIVRALEELQPLLGVAEPPFAALFYKGRCLELMFRYSERHEGLSIQKSTREFQDREGKVRQPFLEISARDVTPRGERGESNVLGPWGLAAQTAMEHFRWMNLHSDYKPLVSIDSITWPGENRP